MFKVFNPRQVHYVFRNKFKITNRHLCSTKRGIIMGIETSCDDTGCAIIDTDGNILGEALNSQLSIHLNNGGIIPPIAQFLHRQNIENVVNSALNQSGISIDDLSAIAVTVKPGLPLSLLIGLKYAKYLCQKHNKPIMPIHHMEAHALTARMHDTSLEFPFLVLLISGGHCLVAVARNVDDFLLLGESIDDAPGEAFDKMARRMKLRNLPEYLNVSGGQAIELAASKADNPLQFKFSIPLLKYNDCNFSFSGIKNQLLLQVYSEEEKHDVPPDGVIPDVNNMCAGFQLFITRHLCHRVQRAMVYAERKGLLPGNRKTLVVSGGAACNNFIAKGLGIVCKEMEYQLVRPPPKLCTDNGVMIAWNGVERWRKNIGIVEDVESVEMEGTSPLGKRLVEEVAEASIKCKWAKLRDLNKPQSAWIS